MPVSFIKEAENAPDYPMLQQCGYSSRYNGFHLSNDCGDVFIRACREKPHCAGGFEGDKFHLSVHESQIAQAVTMLSGALFSDNNPCDRWKITDISQAEPDSRVKRGAQITLYVRPVPGEHPYSAELLSETRRFITGLEYRLTEGGLYRENTLYQISVRHTGNLPATVMKLSAGVRAVRRTISG